MKKFFLVIAAMGLLATSAFAKGGDFGFFYYMSPVHTQTIKTPAGNQDLKSPAYFGLGIGGDWWIINMKDKVDFGINLEGGFDISGNAKLNDETVGTINIAVGGYLSAGPAFQFNVTDRISFTASPSFVMDFIAMSEKEVMIDFYETSNTLASVGYGIDLSLGARLFCSDSFGFQFGVNCGFPLGGNFEYEQEKKVLGEKTKVKFNRDVKSGFDLRIKIGLIWRFGKK